jgi:hypothetical protein
MPAGNCSLIDPEDFIHSCMTVGTHMKFLADWIVVRHSGIYSLGDFLELACDATFWPGLILWVGMVLRDYNKKY